MIGKIALRTVRPHRRTCHDPLPARPVRCDLVTEYAIWRRALLEAWDGFMNHWSSRSELEHTLAFKLWRHKLHKMQRALGEPLASVQRYDKNAGFVWLTRPISVRYMEADYDLHGGYQVWTSKTYWNPWPYMEEDPGLAAAAKSEGRPEAQDAPSGRASEVPVVRA